MKWLISLLSVLLLFTPLPGYVHDGGERACGQNGIDLDEQSVTSGLNNILGITGAQNSVNLTGNDYTQDNPVRDLTLQQYVTPHDPAVKALAESLNKLEGIYDTSGRWVYISDEDLNGVADKWITPHQFLVDSPYYPTNPLPGKAVGDCEEKANTLVSLLRAAGIPPEEVRVVLGEVSFSDVKMGHAWVEIFYNGHWLSLDPSWGPYWDAKSGKVVNRKVVPFDYYASRAYPVIQAWAYYNDVYYLDPGRKSGSFPDSWSLNPSV